MLAISPPKYLNIRLNIYLNIRQTNKEETLNLCGFERTRDLHGQSLARILITQGKRKSPDRLSPAIADGRNGSPSRQVVECGELILRFDHGEGR